MSLRRRLVLTLAPLFIIALVGVDVATYFSLKSFLVSRVDEQLTSNAHVTVEQYLVSGAYGDGGPGGGGQGGNPTAGIPTGTYGAIVTTGGVASAVTDGTTPPVLAPSPVANNSIVSPAWAGAVPAMSPTYAPFRWTPAA